MTQAFRLPTGGIIDRSRPLRFELDGTAYEGYAGDTLASALLANGVHLVARSFKYHRPRGILCSGSDEPNALLQLDRGARTEPNVRATTQELFDGLVAASQNRWPSLRFDVGAINNALSRLLPAGFYYKTFMWPPTPRWWLRYEHFIRRAAGIGRSATAPDPDRYEHQYAHCDVLVIGGGPAGLAAARAAAHAGARVIICDENPAFGGDLRGMNDDSANIDGKACATWIDEAVRDLSDSADVTLLTRTTAFGYYDGNLVALSERVADHFAAPLAYMPRQRMWKVRAGTVVLASGAHERGIAYTGNDLPGTLLAGASRTYIDRHAVRPGSSAVVFTNNDSAYAAALSLSRAGIAIGAIVDAREDSEITGALAVRAREHGIRIVSGSVVAAAHGSKRVTAVDIESLSGGRGARVDCDLVCVSGGWNPAVHLFYQARGSLRYDESLATFVPERSPLAIVAAGGVNGCSDVGGALADGHAAGLDAAVKAGFRGAASYPAPHAEPVAPGRLRPLWSVPARDRSGKRFVDLQNDVTVSDHAGDGHRPGQDQQYRRPRAPRRAASSADSRGRHHDFPPALHPRHPRRLSGRGSRSASRADTLLCDARLARRAWRALHQRGTLDASALVAARRGDARRRCEPRGTERTHQRWRGRRLDAGQDRAAGKRCRRISESGVHQPLGHPRRRPLPLRCDAARRRNGAR